MDWDFKVPPGDSAGLDRDAEPSLSSVAFEPSCRGPRRHPRAPYFSVDLALGGLGDSKDRSKVSTPTMASSLGASRRPPLRPPGSGSRKVACSVDGCGADLSSCKEYHRRHKVCEAHSKTPAVVVGGQEQRFCQQCSRFHSLVEFDEVKRSCRKRLDGHNRRRRKPPPDSTDLGRSFVNNRGIIFSTHPPICSTTTPGQPNRPGTVETGDNFLHAHCLPPHSTSRNQGNPSIHSYIKVKYQFPFLQEEDTTFIRNTTVGIPVCSPHLWTFMPPTSSSNSSSKVFFNGSTEVFDSDCALSLLSPPTKASGTNFVQLFRDPLGLSLREYDKLVPASFSCWGGGRAYDGKKLPGF